MTLICFLAFGLVLNVVAFVVCSPDDFVSKLIKNSITFTMKIKDKFKIFYLPPSETYTAILVVVLLLMFDVIDVF